MVTARATHGDTIVAVSDTGDGIPPEHLSRLFDRFYRVDAARDREHGGAGIGLAIAKALIDAHGGTITATSGGPGAGSTFIFSLPRRVPVKGESPSQSGELAATADVDQPATSLRRWYTGLQASKRPRLVAIELDQSLVADPEVVRDFVEHDVLDLAA